MAGTGRRNAQEEGGPERETPGGGGSVSPHQAGENGQAARGLAEDIPSVDGDWEMDRNTITAVVLQLVTSNCI